MQSFSKPNSHKVRTGATYMCKCTLLWAAKNYKRIKGKVENAVRFELQLPDIAYVHFSLTFHHKMQKKPSVSDCAMQKIRSSVTDLLSKRPKIGVGYLDRTLADKAAPQLIDQRFSFSAVKKPVLSKN